MEKLHIQLSRSLTIIYFISFLCYSCSTDKTESTSNNVIANTAWYGLMPDSSYQEFYFGLDAFTTISESYGDGPVYKYLLRGDSILIYNDQNIIDSHLLIKSFYQDSMIISSNTYTFKLKYLEYYFESFNKINFDSISETFLNRLYQAKKPETLQQHFKPSEESISLE